MLCVSQAAESRVPGSVTCRVIGRGSPSRTSSAIWVSMQGWALPRRQKTRIALRNKHITLPALFLALGTRSCSL